MNPLLRNIMAGFAGAVVSMPANMLLLSPLASLTGAPTLPPPPEGATLAEVQALYAPLIAAMEPLHFVGPILSHWSGAFWGAFAAACLTSNQKPFVPLIVAGFVMIGGVWMAAMTPGQPWWAWTLDLTGYLPMGGLGWSLATRLRRKRQHGA